MLPVKEGKHGATALSKPSLAVELREPLGGVVGWSVLGHLNLLSPYTAKHAGL